MAISFEEKTYNAKVKFSYLGFVEEGSSCMWIQLAFDYEGGVAYTTKICLNNTEQLANLLNVLDLKNWESLPCKFARIKITGKQVNAIGNIIDNKWYVIG